MHFLEFRTNTRLSDSTTKQLIVSVMKVHIHHFITSHYLNQILSSFSTQLNMTIFCPQPINDSPAPHTRSSNKILFQSTRNSDSISCQCQKQNRFPIEGNSLKQPQFYVDLAPQHDNKIKAELAPAFVTGYNIDNFLYLPQM